MAALRPNVILYVMDSLRGDRLGCLGYRKGTTPNIDRFAGDAVVFERAYAQATWTYPSGASMLSGMYPSSLGVHSIRDPLPVNMPWLPEVFKNLGYATACFSANVLISQAFGFERGFDLLVDQFSDPDLPRYRLPVVLQANHKRALERYVDVSDLVLVTSDDLHRAFTAFVERSSDAPCLSVIWSMDTHHPYFDRDDLVSGSPDPIYHQQDIMQMQDPSELSELSELYDRMVWHNDRTFGELLRTLNRLDLYDEAMIIALGDHGEAFGEHGIVTHSGRPYRVQTHVPLLIKLPHSMLAGARRGEICQLTDIFPTLQTFLKFEDAYEARPQGIRLLNGGDSRRATAWSEGDGQLSLRTERWCYMRPPYVDTFGPRGRPLRDVVRDVTRGRLFDLVHDPGETTDMSRHLRHSLSHVRLARQTRTIWHGNQRLRRNMVFDSPDLKPNAVVEDRLRALGYVD
ncbi:MAG TPA: sulfatase [Anaerolineae bacterium]|nr:sulfatase [Anaerolineae bacterium]